MSATYIHVVNLLRPAPCNCLFTTRMYVEDIEHVCMLSSSAKRLVTSYM